MSVTETYSHAHEAFEVVARANDMAPFDMRLLVAIHERGGEARTDELEVDLQACGSAIRRSYPNLWVRGLLKADAGEGTFRPKRGVNTRLTLKASGTRLAVAAIDRANERLEVAA